VSLFVIVGSIPPHAEEDFEPSLGQAAQGGEVGCAFPAFALVVVGGPAAVGEGGVEGEVHQGLVHGVIGGEPAFDAAVFAALDGDRRHAPGGGQVGVTDRLITVFAEAGQQVGDGVGSLDRQGLEDLGVGVLVDPLLDQLVELVDLVMEQLDLIEQAADVQTQGMLHGCGDRQRRGLAHLVDATGGVFAEAVPTDECVDGAPVQIAQVLLQAAALQQVALPVACEVVAERAEVRAPLGQQRTQAVEQRGAIFYTCTPQLDEGA